MPRLRHDRVCRRARLCGGGGETRAKAMAAESDGGETNQTGGAPCCEA